MTIMKAKIILAVPVVALAFGISYLKDVQENGALAQTVSLPIATVQQTPVPTVVPVATVTPVPTSVTMTAPVVRVQYAGGVEQWRGITSKYFGAATDTALAIMACESGGNPYSHNQNAATGDNSVGLYQINLFGGLASSRPSAEWLFVPENNISYAASMWKSQGFYPWSCYRKI